MESGLGRFELQALTYAQSNRLETLRSDQLVHKLGWSVSRERNVLSRLSKRSILARVRPGLYLVPPQLPFGGTWSPSEHLALHTLMNDLEGAYQITGPNVFHRFGWTDQIPNQLFVMNNKISGPRQIGAVRLSCIKVKSERLGGTETIRSREGFDVFYASRPRALIDAIRGWSVFGTLPAAYRWLSRQIAADESFPSEVVRLACQYGNFSAIRRLGAFLEERRVPDGLLKRLEVKLPPFTSVIPLDPKGLSSEVETDLDSRKRWGILWNYKVLNVDD